MSPALLQEELERRARRNRLPKALVLVHLYGQAANITPIAEACRTYDVTLIEDAAEALGASYQGRAPGTFGQSGIFSFNGNKIITTSGGGMLVSDDSTLIEHARKLSTQARDPAPHYQHSEIGYNYRLSNVLAGIGRGQLRVLDDRVRKRRANFDFYRQTLGELPGIEFQPEADWGVHSRWLTVLTVDEQRFKSSTEEIRETLESQNIEARPVWKPMHLQPIFDECEVVGGETSERLFRQGLCLPSGSSLTRTQLELIADTVRSCHAAS
jgi:pyridoxal phosphate-dependent aminotransferase EpsN